MLGKFPVPVEVIPMARGLAARAIMQLGGQPVYRENFITDNGNIILDVHHLTILNPLELEKKLNGITGVVTCGIFAQNPADTIMIASNGKITCIYKK